MSLFGKRDTGPRSAEERERARREREIARARREGRPDPVFDDAPYEPPPAPFADPVEPLGPAAPYEPVGEEPPAHAPDAADPHAAPAADLDWDPYAAEWDQPAPLDAAHDAPADPFAGQDDPFAAHDQPTAAHDVPDALDGPADAHDAHDPLAPPPGVEDDPLAPHDEPAQERPRGRFARSAPPEEERPAWDRTDAWDALPPEQAPAEPTPRPTLGEELGAVDRGEARSWFDDDEDAAPPAGRSEEPGQETVEWDVLANRPKERPQPPEGPAGADQPTVEWDVTKHLAREPAPEPPAPASNGRNGHAPDAGDGAAEDAEPAVARGRELDAPDPVESVGRATPRRRGRGADAAAGAAGAAGATSPGGAAGAAGGAGSPGAVGARAARGRFGDEHERPAPTRRGNRARTLPPPPPGPGEKRRRTGPGKPSRRGAIAGVLVLVIVAIVLYFANAVFQPFAGEGGKQVTVTVPANSSVGDVGELLEKEGVVESASFFTLRARMDGGALQAGQYTLKEDMSYADAIDTLKEGPAAPKTIRVAIPEGRARREVVPIVKQAELKGSYLQASEKSSSFDMRKYGAPKRTSSLEGFLYPATYELKPGATSRQLVAQQLQAFRDNISNVSMKRARARNLSTYEVLIIASMIDREATLAKERRTISAVIHNRLRQGMPLGIDATIRFATRNWSKPLKESELAIDSPYNTRRRTGLPPGPIGSPGLASIKAAANPSDSKAIYYVVKPCGKGAHNFSSTDAQFQKDVAAYNREREKRGGKSPVNC